MIVHVYVNVYLTILLDYDAMHTAGALLALCL